MRLVTSPFGPALQLNIERRIWLSSLPLPLSVMISSKASHPSFVECRQQPLSRICRASALAHLFLRSEGLGGQEGA